MPAKICLSAGFREILAVLVVIVATRNKQHHKPAMSRGGNGLYLFIAVLLAFSGLQGRWLEQRGSPGASTPKSPFRKTRAYIAQQPM
jgi:hypothetical protein